ncbi:YfjI family protein [Anaeromusa sp.]|uniref:YfjI family protein n=1 Tax=Anaeromusa sp. TaxID=1872520 RepID=UPI00261E020D|nr:YfjI family protein [Anaeromusa sp.]MDD3158619.1 YfjI family protein [Anaeromusa sp.]
MKAAADVFEIFQNREKRKAEQEAAMLDEWPEPGEIKESALLPVAQITPEMLPKAFKDWLFDVAYRMQCPLEFVAVGAVVAASAVIGAGCGIRPKRRDNWTITPNLWGAIVARPSQKKTPSLKESLLPLEALEEAAVEQNESDARYYEAKKESFKAAKDAVKKDMAKAAGSQGKNKSHPGKSMNELEEEYANMIEPEEPGFKRFIAKDASIEKLGEMLRDNPRGLLVFRDELVGLLASWDREDRQQDRAFYLEAWNGNQKFITDRIGRGTVLIKNTCLSVLGGIQPGKLQTYLLQCANSLKNDGMLQRIQLLVYPDEPEKEQIVDEYPNGEALKRAYAIFEKLATMDFLKAGAVSEISEEEKEKIFFRFTDEAQEVFFEWYLDNQKKAKEEEYPPMCEHLSKYPSLVPSLALVFHLIEVAGGAAPGPVSEAATVLACTWADVLESHARRVYGMSSDTKQASASALAKKIKAGELGSKFTVRDLYRKGWALLDEAGAGAACQELEAEGWLRRVPFNGPGRPKEEYEVNPKIIKKAPVGN